MHDIIFEHNQNNVFIIQVFVMAGSAFESSGEHMQTHQDTNTKLIIHGLWSAL